MNMEPPIWLILLAFAVGVVIFYPDIVAKILAIVLIIWICWDRVTE
jgi:hypothetical protein